jgi:acyl-[acyl carrier protein]--UDP-N-acetylglucosamine O-acyltransferase
MARALSISITRRSVVAGLSRLNADVTPFLSLDPKRKSSSVKVIAMERRRSATIWSKPSIT